MSTNGKDSSILADVKGLEQHEKDWGYEKKDMAMPSLGRSGSEGPHEQGKKGPPRRGLREGGNRKGQV